MKKVLLIVGAILLAAVIGGGSFWGGMRYQANKASQAQANFFNARGGQAPGGGQFPREGAFPGNGQPGGGPGSNNGAFFAGGRGTMGEVKSIEGNVLTLSTAEDVTTVNLSEDTEVTKTASGTLDDLQPGTRVMVTGETDSEGTISANRITILNDNPPGLPNPPATETAP